jgi:hypothetical protein
MSGISQDSPGDSAPAAGHDAAAAQPSPGAGIPDPIAKPSRSPWQSFTIVSVLAVSLLALAVAALNLNEAASLGGRAAMQAERPRWDDFPRAERPLDPARSSARRLRGEWSGRARDGTVVQLHLYGVDEWPRAGALLVEASDARCAGVLRFANWIDRRSASFDYDGRPSCQGQYVAVRRSGRRLRFALSGMLRPDGEAPVVAMLRRVT